MALGFALFVLLNATTPQEMTSLREVVAVACSTPSSVDLKNLRMPMQAVPDAARAVVIATVAFRQFYGPGDTSHDRPYAAEGVDDFWFVYAPLPEGALGGGPVAVIDRNTGQFRCLAYEE